jgi:hypothetical protein
VRRQLTTLALAALFGGLMLSSDASACCFKKKCKQPCAPTVCVAPVPAPCPPPAPCVQTCGPRKKLFGGLCHKKRACATVAYCAPGYPAPVYQGAYASVQSVYPTGQH